MKKNKITVIALSALIFLILNACHTETPLGIDKEAPEVQILTIYTETSSLYDSSSGNVFENFSDTLLTEKLFINVSVSDNEDLYKITLQAEDSITGYEYDIKIIDAPANGGEVVITSDYKDFPVVQDTDLQRFYLKVQVSDASENKMISKEKLGFVISKPIPVNILYYELGLIEEIEGDSIDFREKNGKLAFVQFMYKGCLSCVEEARDVKSMYEDPSYGLEEYSHSMFGRSFESEKEFLDYKLKTERLPFDCFLDQPDNTVKKFFEQLTGEVIETAFFAVMPNGEIIKYKYEIDFSDWLDLMYSTAYPNK